MKKITHKQAIFYQLYKLREEDLDKYIPIWKLIGEVYIEELGQWAFVSYEVSARTSEIKKANPNLLEWTPVRGKSGAIYNAYRLRKGVSVLDIEDPKLLSFYKKIKSNK